MTHLEHCICDETVTEFQCAGFVHLRNLLPRKTLGSWSETIREAVRRENTETRPLEERDTYGQAFLQTMNLWRTCERAREIVFSRELASIARQLLGTSGVRLYHDQALFKEAGGGHTPWHADAHYWPIGAARTVTAWIPLVDVPDEMGPLAFARESHSLTNAMAWKISDASEAEIEKLVVDENLDVLEEPYEIGDVSFHLGGTLHRAGANSTSNERAVMTIIYFEENARLRAPTNPEQERDAQRWCPGVRVGELCDSELNPVLDTVQSEQSSRIFPTI